MSFFCSPRESAGRAEWPLYILSSRNTWPSASKWVAPLEAALKEIIASDLVMLGPDPSAIVEMIRRRDNCDVIVGNLDLWVVDKRWEWMKPKNIYHEWMLNMARGSRERMTEDQLHYLSTLPFSMSYVPEPGHEFFIFHATPKEVGDVSALPPRLTDDEVREHLGGTTAGIMAHGHIHGPYVRQIGEQTIVCCAAVGMSWDGDPRPSYVTVEYKVKGKWDVEIKRINYDYESQAKYNENCWIEHGGQIAKMLRTGYFWNPEHMPH